MRVITSKSKNAESFYISRGFINDKGISTSVIVRKLGTLKDLLLEHGPTRNDVMAWAKEEARLETLKYKQEQLNKSVQITFHADRQLDFDKQVLDDNIKNHWKRKSLGSLDARNSSIAVTLDSVRRISGLTTTWGNVPISLPNQLKN